MLKRKLNGAIIAALLLTGSALVPVLAHGSSPNATAAQEDKMKAEKMKEDKMQENKMTGHTMSHRRHKHRKHRMHKMSGKMMHGNKKM